MRTMKLLVSASGLLFLAVSACVSDSPNSDGGSGGKNGSAGGGTLHAGGSPGDSGGTRTATGGSPGTGGAPNDCTAGIPLQIVWESGWVDRKNNPDTEVQGPWYTYKDTRATTTIDPADGAAVTKNCATGHIEPKSATDTDAWGAGFAVDLNSAGGAAPVKDPITKPWKTLCVDVTVTGGTVDLELPMNDQTSADPPFGVAALKNGVNKVDLTSLKVTTWGVPKANFDVSKLISLKFKMNTPPTKAVDTTVCVNGVYVGLP